MSFRRVQPSKTFDPIEITLLGIVILVRLVQFLKAALPMEVILFESVMLLKLVQPEKAKPPICVTLCGIVMSVRLEQYLKAFPPMDITLSAIST